MKEILGSSSAYSVAKEAGKNNMMISAPFIIEVLDRIKELEANQEKNDLNARAETWQNAADYSVGSVVGEFKARANNLRKKAREL